MEAPFCLLLTNVVVYMSRVGISEVGYLIVRWNVCHTSGLEFQKSDTSQSDGMFVILQGWNFRSRLPHSQMECLSYFRVGISEVGYLIVRWNEGRTICSNVWCVYIVYVYVVFFVQESIFFEISKNINVFIWCENPRLLLSEWNL